MREPLLVGVLVLAAAASIVVVSVDAPTPVADGNRPFTLAVPLHSLTYPAVWSINRSNISRDEHAVLHPAPGSRILVVPDGATAEDRFRSGAADMVLLPPTALPRLAAGDEVRILRSMLVFTPEMPAVYTVAGSNITAPEQLAGRRMAVAGSFPAALTMFALDTVYGVNALRVETVSSLQRDALTLLEQGEVDAVQRLRYPSQPNALSRLFRPFQVLREAGPGTPAAGLFIVDAAADTERARSVAARFSDAIRDGLQHPDRVARHVNTTLGKHEHSQLARVFNALAAVDGGDLRDPMGADDVALLQALLDYTARTGHTTEPVNVSALLLPS